MSQTNVWNVRNLIYAYMGDNAHLVSIGNHPDGDESVLVTCRDPETFIHALYVITNYGPFITYMVFTIPSYSAIIRLGT